MAHLLFVNELGLRDFGARGFPGYSRRPGPAPERADLRKCARFGIGGFDGWLLKRVGNGDGTPQPSTFRSDRFAETCGASVSLGGNPLFWSPLQVSFPMR